MLQTDWLVKNNFKTWLFIIGFCAFSLIPGAAHAERIRDFTSNIIVNNDATIQVTETITYDFEGASRHGIFRDISRDNHDGSLLTIDNLVVTDETGDSYPVSVTNDFDSTTIKIGDPNVLVSGVKTYKISYMAKNAIVSFDGYDEIYWNVTGDDWSVPIDSVNVSFKTPTVVQSSCYRGEQGSSVACTSFKNGDATVQEGSLDPGEGVTIAIGFKKGVVAGITRIGGQTNGDFNPQVNYGSRRRISDTMSYLIGGILLVGMIIVRFVSRDNKSKNPVIAHYEPPQNLSPIQAGVMIDKGLDFRDITAQMISLAQRGYVTISYLEKKVLLVFNTTDYQFTLTKSPEGLDDTDIKILQFIFGNTLQQGAMVTLEDISNRSRYVSQSLFRDIQKTEEEKFVDQGFMEKNKLRIVGVLFIALAGLGVGVLHIASPIFFAMGILIVILTSTMHPRRMTDKGADLKQELLGFKDFLSVTDKDRFDFHNAPEKKPEQFMQYLPYAIAFRVEEKWAKQFEGVMVPEPVWYHGQAGQPFSAALFASNMTGLGSSLSSFAKVASSGSGGSGSSGGGSGGGGGGSW